MDLFFDLVALFFLSFFYYFLMFLFLMLSFNLITLFIYLFFFLFHPFSSELCGRQVLGAPAGCQVCAAEVGEPSSGHWSTRDLLAPCNIKQ